MKLSNVLGAVLVVLLVVVTVSLLGSYVLGYPVLLGYVESGSMSDTLEEGDGFVSVPAPLAGDAGQNDVVVFQAEEIHGGDLTTHRIVEERPEGYITQGDNNPFTDQSTGEPPVTDGQVKAVALTMNGEVVRIPQLGSGAAMVSSTLDTAERTVAGALGVRRLGSEQLAYILFGAGTLLFLATLLVGTEHRKRERARSRSRPGVIDMRLVLVGCIVLIWVGATAGMIAPAGTETYDIVSTEGDSSNPTIIPVGETDSFESELHNGGVLPTVSYLEPRSDGIEITPNQHRMGRNETANATVTFHALDETGRVVRSMTEYRYFAILPAPVIDSAYQTHPWLPYLLINTVLTVPFVFLWLVIGGTPTTVRLRNRDRPTSSGIFEKILGG